MSDRTARLESLRKIVGDSVIAMLERRIGLSLGNKSLTSVPLGVWDLTRLEKLSLGFNQLSSLPPEISDLVRLTHLGAQFNKLSSLPPEISLLTRLTVLEVNFNELSSLPPEISRLTGLTYLEVHFNKLSSVPLEICQLTGLTHLNICGNPIEEIPSLITALTNLKKFWVHDSNGEMNIKRAPCGITNLPCWNNTSDKNGGLSIADALRKLELYDPMALPPTLPPNSSPTPSRLASGEYADVLTTDFEKSENIIGKGGFGMVFKVQLKAGLFAVKKIDDTSLPMTTEGIDPEKEGNRMLELKHANILALFDFGYRDKDFLFVMEFADGGDLCSLVTKKKALGNDLSIKFGLHIIQGLVYLHTRPQPIQHCDLKTENVLLVNGVAKLTDFGLSKSGVSVNSVSGLKGSKNWSPPEVFEEGMSVGLPSDVYSYGVVLWSMLSGEYPYEGLSEREVGTKVMSGNLLLLPSTCPPNLVTLIHKCWERNYDRRINAPQVEAELKQVEADLKQPPMTPLTFRSKPVEDMNPAELIVYLEGENANPDFIQACKDSKIGGLDFVLMTEEDVKELIPQLESTQVRGVMTLIVEAKST